LIFDYLRHAEAGLRNEKINYKVREHSLAKVLVMLVVGKREADERAVNVRRLGSQEQKAMTLDGAATTLTNEAETPDRTNEMRKLLT
jgi:threonyl-tRNA synthetase